MAPSASDGVADAVRRLRAARDQARQRRAAASEAVEQLRERNREESRRLAERARLGRRAQPQWPGHQDQPRELHLYDAEEPDASPAPATGVPPQLDVPHGPRRASDDDWSQESWLR